MGRSRVLVLLSVLAVSLASRGNVGCAGDGGQLERTQSDAETREIEPPDVFMRLALVQAELDLIRREEGKPKSKRLEIDVANAAPREVFFQARTLFRKANRFCFERTLERVAPPAPPVGEIRPKHVLVVVDAALGRVRRVKRQLDIPEPVEATPRDPTKTPIDVFRSIIQANRQINLMLDRRFAPSETYEQVTLSVSYASRLLAQFPGTTRIPEAPPFERRKLPRDVYARLIRCFEHVREIATVCGLSVLELTVNEEQLEEVEPSDVHDVATLMVSELAYLHAQSKNAEPPIDVYHPGRKLPAHVYQRVGILEAQLVELLEHVEKMPNSLRGDTRE